MLKMLLELGKRAYKEMDDYLKSLGLAYTLILLFQYSIALLALQQSGFFVGCIILILIFKVQFLYAKVMRKHLKINPIENKGEPEIPQGKSFIQKSDHIKVLNYKPYSDKSAPGD